MIGLVPFAVLIAMFRLWLLIASWEVKRIMATPREQRWVQWTSLHNGMNQLIFLLVSALITVIIEMNWLWY